MLQDIACEKAVLAGIYQYGAEALIDVSDLINANTFTIDKNQLLYTCLDQTLQNNKSIDLTAIIVAAEYLHIKDRILKDKQDIQYIRALLNFPIKLENVRGYAKRLAKLEFARYAQAKHKHAHDELAKLTGSESIDQILAISENAVFELIQDINRGDKERPVLISENSTTILQNRLDNPIEMAGLPTPWPCYNSAIGGGLRTGGVNIIAARPGIGKSAMSKELALHAALNLKIPVLYIDTEMIQEDQLFRSIASLSNIPINKIETGQFKEARDRVFEISNLLNQAPFYHKSVAGKPFEEILSIIRRWIVKEVGYSGGNINNCLIIYDYFKLMSPDSLKDMQEYQALGFQISRLSDFCKEYDFPCMAFVQVNRDGITKETSDIISQSDRLLWLCHSAALFKPKNEGESTPQDKGSNRKLIILKARFGPGMSNPSNYINMRFDGEIAKITEIGFQNELMRDNIINEEGFVRSGENISGIN